MRPRCAIQFHLQNHKLNHVAAHWVIIILLFFTVMVHANVLGYHDKESQLYYIFVLKNYICMCYLKHLPSKATKFFIYILMNRFYSCVVSRSVKCNGWIWNEGKDRKRNSVDSSISSSRNSSSSCGVFCGRFWKLREIKALHAIYLQPFSRKNLLDTNALNIATPSAN